MLYLTKEQIKSLVEKVGQPEATNIIKRYYHSYQKFLHSTDLLDLYDAAYFKTLDHLVSKFTTEKGVVLSEYNRPAYSYLLKKMNQSDTALDIGCGSGDFVIALAACGYSKVVGIDFAKDAIAEANQKREISKLDNCEFACKDVSDFDSDHKFKFITLNDVTEHLSDTELRQLFNKVHKVIDNDGELLIHTPNGIALCHDTHKNWLQEFRKFLKRLRGWKGFEWTVDQLHYYQEHINVKGYKNLKNILNECGFTTRVIYDEPHKIKPLSYLFSSNMLVIAKKK